MNKDITAISDTALAVIKNYEWPGNIRELQNAIERALVLTRHDVIEPSDLPENIRPHKKQVFVPTDNQQGTLPLRQAKRQWEKKFIERALARHNGNISRTAQAIELARKNLQEKIRQYEIDIPGLTGKNC